MPTYLRELFKGYKLATEVQAPLSGKVTFTVKVGDTAIIGAKIAEIDTD